jgi:hypothetical protein
MSRAILCRVVILAMAAGCHQAATTNTSSDQKGRRGGRPPGARGTVARVDAAAGTLTIKARSRDNPDGEEKTFQVDDETTITSFTGENKTELKGKAGLSDPQFKPGSQVSIRTSEDGGKVVSIQVGDLPRRGRNRGGKDAKQPVQ